MCVNLRFSVFFSKVIQLSVLTMMVNSVFGQDDIYFIPEKKNVTKNEQLSSVTETKQLYDSSTIRNNSVNEAVEVTPYERYRINKELKYYSDAKKENSSQVDWDNVKDKRYVDTSTNSSEYTDEAINNIYNIYLTDDYYYNRPRGYVGMGFGYYDPYYSFYYGDTWGYPYNSWSWSFGWGYPYSYGGYYGGYYAYSGYYSHYPYFYPSCHSGYYPYYEGSVTHYKNAGIGRRRGFSGVSTPTNSRTSGTVTSRRVEESNGRMGTSSAYPSNPDRRKTSVNRRQEYNSRMVYDSNSEQNRTVTEQNTSTDNSQGNTYTPSYSQPRSESRPTYNAPAETPRRRVVEYNEPQNTGNSYSGGSDSNGSSRRSDGGGSRGGSSGGGGRRR